MIRRYVSEFADRHNTRPEMVAMPVQQMAGKRSTYRDLVGADSVGSVV